MNKFLILIVAILFASEVSNAQTEKGAQTLGANFGINYTNANDFTITVPSGATSTLNTKTTGFNIGPNYSYFIANNLDIGANLSYALSNTTNNTENLATTNNSYPTKEHSDNFSASAFIRKYFMYKNKIGFRTGGYIGYTNGNENDNYTPSLSTYNFISNTNYYSAGANLDLVYYPTKKLGIAATIANLEYYHYTANNTTQGHDSGDNLTFNFINNGLSLSVFYVFGSK